MRKKKNYKLRLFFLMSIFIFSVLFPNTIMAQSNDDITADIIAEISKDDASVKVTVYLKNTGNQPVNNVKIQGILPKGLQVESGYELNKQVPVLTPGSETGLQYTLYTDQKQENMQRPSDLSTGNHQPNNGINSTTTNNSTKNNHNINTGDNTNPTFLIIVCMISLVIIIALCIKIKKGRGLFFLLGITILTPSFIGLVPVEAVERAVSISVQTDAVLKGKHYNLAANIEYTLPEAVIPSGEVLTRAQWIDELLMASGIPEQEIKYVHVDLPFTDIMEHPNKNDILIAYANKFLPDMGSEFNPDAPVDREFAAVTAVKALGFYPVSDIICDDSEMITYKKEVETAVAMDIFRLLNNTFRPSDSLTRAEADTALNKIREIANPIIPEGNEGSVIYKKNVVMIPEDARYIIDNTTITFLSEIENLNEGVIFVMPNQTPYKVISSQKINNTLVIETQEPDISETIDSINTVSSATLDISNFIPADGVSIVNSQKSMTLDVKGNIIDVEGSLSGPGKIDFNFHKKTENGELYGNISVSLPKVYYKADIDLSFSEFNINDVFLKFQTDIETTDRFESTEDNNGYIPDEYMPNRGLFELGKIPMAGILA